MAIDQATAAPEAKSAFGWRFVTPMFLGSRLTRSTAR